MRIHINERACLGLSIFEQLVSVVTESNTTRSVHMEVQPSVHVDGVVVEDDADNGATSLTAQQCIEEQVQPEATFDSYETLLAVLQGHARSHN